LNKETDKDKKKKKKDDQDPRFEMPVVDRRETLMATGTSNVWLISFTDVIALMLTFFVLMFSMINPEREIYSNITYVLKNNGAFGSTEQSGLTNRDANQRIQVIRGEDLNYLASVLRQNIKGRGALYGAEIINENSRLVIRLPNRLLFDSGAHELRAGVAPELADLFTLLTNLKNAIEVYGYTDPVPVSGLQDEYTSNYGLAQQRAASIARLIYETGYRKSVGLFGIEENGQNADDYAEMRRVEIMIHENRGTLF